jgi:hypothetical protein
MAEKKWRPVPGFEGAYEVSKDGRVYSHHTGRTLTPYLNTPRGRESDQYFRVDLRKNGDRRQAYVHHVVLEAWFSERPDGAHAHHRNGDHHDNRLANLEWIGAEEHLNGHAEDTDDSDSTDDFAPVEEGAPF